MNKLFCLFVFIANIGIIFSCTTTTEVVVAESMIRTLDLNHSGSIDIVEVSKFYENYPSNPSAEDFYFGDSLYEFTKRLFIELVNTYDQEKNGRRDYTLDAEELVIFFKDNGHEKIRYAFSTWMVYLIGPGETITEYEKVSFDLGFNLGYSTEQAMKAFRRLVIDISFYDKNSVDGKDIVADALICYLNESNLAESFDFLFPLPSDLDCYCDEDDDDEHEHENEHAHEPGHEHEHKHGQEHEHEHEHGHEHEHEHEQEHEHEHGREHEHEHEHGREHEQEHEHEHEHEHGQEHEHKHEQEHDHEHKHEQQQEHEHDENERRRS